MKSPIWKEALEEENTDTASWEQTETLHASLSFLGL